MTIAADLKPQRLSREKQKAQRRNNLLDAAWALFCDIGYDDMTVEAISDRAGLSRMPVYSLFGDKQGLFFDLWQRQTQNLATLFLAGCTPDRTLQQNLATLATTITNADQIEGGQYRAALFYVVQGLSINRPDIRQKVGALATDLIDRFAQMIDQSVLAPGQSLAMPADMIARHILAQINGAATITFQTEQTFLTADQLTATFIGIALTPTK